MLLLGFIAITLLPVLLFVQRFQQEELFLNWNVMQFVDFWITFSIAGIAGVCYHVYFGKHYHKIPKPDKTTHTSSGKWILSLFVLAALLPWATLFFNSIFGLSVAASLLVTAGLLTLYIGLHRTDLFADSIWSAFLTGFVVLLVTSFLGLFTGIDFTYSAFDGGVMFFLIPLDLLAWSLALGLFLGPIYEYVRTLELK